MQPIRKKSVTDRSPPPPTAVTSLAHTSNVNLEQHTTPCKEFVKHYGSGELLGVLFFGTRKIDIESRMKSELLKILKSCNDLKKNIITIINIKQILSTEMMILLIRQQTEDLIICNSKYKYYFVDIIKICRKKSKSFWVLPHGVLSKTSFYWML